VKNYHFNKKFRTFVLDDHQLGVSTLTLDLTLDLDLPNQETLDVCMSRIYSVIDNIFNDGIICVDDNEAGEIVSSAISNFCVQIPKELNYEILSEIVCHKIQAVTDNKATVTRLVIIPVEHNFGIEFNTKSQRNYVEGFKDRWWLNPNLKFSDFKDEELNAEVAWEEINLGWPTAPTKKRKKSANKTPAVEAATTDNVVIEFPLNTK
jgi:hypothetical protein